MCACSYKLLLTLPLALCHKILIAYWPGHRIRAKSISNTNNEVRKPPCLLWHHRVWFKSWKKILWTRIPLKGVGHRGDSVHSFILDLLFAASGQSLGTHGFLEPQCSPIDERTDLARDLHSNSQGSWIHDPPAELHPVLLSIACVPDKDLSAKMLENPDISRAWEGIRNWIDSESMHRSSLSASSWYRAKPNCPQKKEMLSQQYEWRWKVRWWRVGRIRERRVKLSKHCLCNVFVCSAMYPCVLYSLLCWGGLAGVWWQGCRWVCSNPHAGRRAGEKDAARNPCPKEWNPLNDSFAPWGTLVKTCSVLKLV